MDLRRPQHPGDAAALDGAPYGPWTLKKGDDGDAVQGFDPFAGTALRIDALLYEAAAQLGVDPLTVDEMEVWQVGAMFGLPDDPEANRGAGITSPAMKPTGDLVAQRYAALMGKGPKMEAEPTGGELVQFLEQVGRRG